MTVSTKKRSVRRQDLLRIVGKDSLHRSEARRIVMARTGIVIDEMMHYMFKLRDHVPQLAEDNPTARSFERRAIGMFDGATTLAEAGNGEPFDNRDEGGVDGIAFSETYKATYQQLANCRYYAGVIKWFTGFMGGYCIGTPALIGKNAAGEIVAIIAGFDSAR